MSNKNLTNNQLLLKEIISQEYEDNNQFASLDTFFELFSAGQILKDYAFSNEEIDTDYCTNTLGIPLENIKYIEDATLNKIRYGINWISNIVKVQEKQPNVIFYYSGHGVPDETSRNAYLLPSDGLANDFQSGYSLDLLYKQLGELHTNKGSPI